jgi:hypothetical protein
MTMKVQWYIPGKVIYIRYEGEITPVEMANAFQFTSQQIDTVADGIAVHGIGDMIGSRLSMTNLGKWNEAAQSWVKHPKLGWTIMRLDDKIMKFFASTIIQVAKARVRIVSEYADIPQFLTGIDLNLHPPLPAMPPALNPLATFERHEITINEKVGQ